MLRLLACCLIGFATMIFGVFGDVARQATSVPTRTPTPTPMRSLFEADTCAPPCWFGLIPGQSTSQDVWTLLQTNLDLVAREEDVAGTFYPGTDYLIEGYYSFYLGYGNFRSLFVVRDGVLSWMNIAVGGEHISLSKTLDVFGQPNAVHTTIGLYEVILTLFYRDANMFVFLTADREDCDLPHILEHYTADSIFYYSPDVFQELTASLYRRDVKVPKPLWRAWLNGEVNDFCEDAINQLFGVPDTATQTRIDRPTPTPTATQVATR